VPCIRKTILNATRADDVFSVPDREEFFTLLMTRLI
jgi:hypothetical protein